MPSAVTHSRDADGRAVVSVHLGNHPEPAVLYLPDYEAIVAACPKAFWFVNRNRKAGQLYVRLKCPIRRNNEMVARLVAGHPASRRIRYRDGNRLNLRSTNLEQAAPFGALRLHNPAYQAHLEVAYAPL